MSYYSSPFSIWIGLAMTCVVVCFILYCVRLKFNHRYISTHPMQVVVLAHPNHVQMEPPPPCWTVPVEQPPPPYSAVVTDTSTYGHTVHANNAS